MRGGFAGDFFFLLLFFTLVTGPRRSLSLKLSDTRVYEPQTRARFAGENADWARVTRDLGRVRSGWEARRQRVAGQPCEDLGRRDRNRGEQPNVMWYRGGLVFEAHRLLYHSS